MINHRTITRSQVLGMTGTLIALWLMAIGLSTQVMRHEFDERFDSALQETANRLLEISVSDVDLRLAPGNEQVSDSDTSQGRDYLIYQIRRPNGEIIMRSKDAPDELFSAPLLAGFQETAAYRIYTKASSKDKLIVQVADSFGDRREAVGESVVAMLIPLLAFILASGLAIWTMVKRVLNPIGELQRAICNKNEGNLTPVEIGRVSRELMPIARSVNLLLERLQTAFDAERDFTAHCAHELRTPIAGALAQTQCLVSDLPEGAWKQRAVTVENSLRKLGRLIEKLLQLARASSQTKITSVAVDVGPVLDMLVTDFQRDTGTRGRLQYRRPKSAPMVHDIDVDAFGIVTRNLIENAIIHGEPNTPVNISVAGDGSIHIVNECAVLANLTLLEMKKRFTRGNNKASGSGLGLAISDQLVKQMGGTLDLYSPVPGRDTGFEAVLSFQPLQPSEESRNCSHS